MGWAGRLRSRRARGLLLLVAAACLLAGCVSEGDPNNTATQGWNNNMWQLRVGTPVNALGTLEGAADPDNWVFHTDVATWNIEGTVGPHQWMNWSSYLCQARITNSSGVVTGCSVWLPLVSGTLGSADSTTSTSGRLLMIQFPCSGADCSRIKTWLRIKLDSTTTVNYGMHLQVG
jgi:hypothetical protein